ncbi:MAG TPA: response regulator transcription factor [Conexibacter sp.]|nr:response regulator transcription factor [Conexibacter sp.]
MHIYHTTVVLVDTNLLFRAGLRALLERDGIAVVGEAPSVEAALQLVERCRPDVVVVDPDLPDMADDDACEAIRRIKERVPVTHVLALARATSERDGVDIVCMGGAGFLLKEAPAETILAGVRAAAAGEALIAPRVAASLVRRLRASGAGERPQPRSVLSGREQEVLRLIADGKDNDAIATELFISRHTVKNHISSILMKLEVTNRVQAAVLAVRTAMV